MVRCLVSSMVAVGAGTLDEAEIDRRLESGDRHQLPQPAPAAGLALIGVGYDTAGVADSTRSLDRLASCLTHPSPALISTS